MAGLENPSSHGALCQCQWHPSRAAYVILGNRRFVASRAKVLRVWICSIKFVPDGHMRQLHQSFLLSNDISGSGIRKFIHLSIHPFSRTVSVPTWNLRGAEALSSTKDTSHFSQGHMEKCKEEIMGCYSFLSSNYRLKQEDLAKVKVTWWWWWTFKIQTGRWTPPLPPRWEWNPSYCEATKLTRTWKQ